MSGTPEGNIDPKLIAEINGAFINERTMPIKIRIKMAAVAINAMVATLDAELEAQANTFFNINSAPNLGFSWTQFGISNDAFLTFTMRQDKQTADEEALALDTDAHDELREVDRELFTPLSKARLALLGAKDGIQAAHNLSRHQAEKAVNLSRKIR